MDIDVNCVSMPSSRPEPFLHRDIPARAGIGLRAQHYRDFLERHQKADWVEIHTENLFAAGGTAHRVMAQVRRDYPLSFHGVSLSLGSGDPLSQEHLRIVRALVERYEPGLVSDHLSWISAGGRYLHDLLPLPYTEEMLHYIANRVIQVQEFLQRPILIENPSAYLHYAEEQMPEWEFLNRLARESGCGILLDVNNLYVCSRNLGIDADEYLVNLQGDIVQEIHLAGFSVESVGDHEILVDTHSRGVWLPVWELYARALTVLRRPLPTLIEWDAEIPSIDVLLQEARQAQYYLDKYHD
ncbi:MAG: MNIO family bufferin maturase [Acidiferrobacter sp.]